MRDEIQALRRGRTGPAPAGTIERLVALLTDESYWEEPGDVGAPPFVRVVGEEALAALLDWGDAAEVLLPELLRLVGSAPTRARLRAAEVACGLGDHALERVAALSNDGDPVVRRGMIAALGRGIVPSRPEHAPYFLALMRRLLDESTNVVFAADEVLRAKNSRWSPRAAHPPALAEALRSWIEEAPDAVSSLEARVASPDSRFTAVRALGHLVGISEAGAALARVAIASKGQQLEAAAESLVSVGPVLSQETIDTLVDVFVERQGTSVGLMRAFGAYGPRASRAVPMLVEAMGRPPGDRSYATRVATEARRKTAMEALARIRGG